MTSSGAGRGQFCYVVAADAAVTAAEKILRDTAKGKIADDLIAQGIADVKSKLN